MFSPHFSSLFLLREPIAGKLRVCVFVDLDVLQHTVARQKLRGLVVYRLLSRSRRKRLRSAG